MITKEEHAFDCVSEKESFGKICKALDNHSGKLTIVLPHEIHKIPHTIEHHTAMAGSLWDGFNNNHTNG